MVTVVNCTHVELIILWTLKTEIS